MTVGAALILALTALVMFRLELVIGVIILLVRAGLVLGAVVLVWWILVSDWPRPVSQTAPGAVTHQGQYPSGKDAKYPFACETYPVNTCGDPAPQVYSPDLPACSDTMKTDWDHCITDGLRPKVKVKGLPNAY